MDTITIYRWPDGTWCEYDDIESYLQWMSDDYDIVFLTQDEYEAMMHY